MAYAVLLDPGGDAITRDYVAYMTSAQVLLGAEFDKVVSILVVTLILAVAIVRARRLLVRSATEGAAASDLSRFFSPGGRGRRSPDPSSASSRASGETGRRGGAVQCDIRGFTRLSLELAARRPDVIRLLAEYEATHGSDAIRRNTAAASTSIMGDGIMATFGAVDPLEAAGPPMPLSAVDELVAVAEAEWRRRAPRRRATQPLEIGFAVATRARSIFGAVGDPKGASNTR